jgi:hypothetical protein
MAFGPQESCNVYPCGDCADAGVDAGPSPAGTCWPNQGSEGNALGIGKWCRFGGSECPGNTVCGTVYGSCILPGCTTNEACGEQACCWTDGYPAGTCLPILCLVDAGQLCPLLPVADAGFDGGAPD